MNNKKPLAGKTALITGASQGFGSAIAQRFHAAGAKLILAARSEIRLASFADAIDRSIRWIAVDLAMPAQVDELIAFCLNDGHSPDILVNNAAIQGPIGPFDAMDFAAFRNVMEVNFFAPARICQKLIASMRQNKWGKIINISGGGATSPRPDFSGYASSKCALVRLSETLALEFAGSGVDINCLAPGAMNTQMLEQLLAAGPQAAKREYEKALKQRQSGGASPEQAADLALFLASPASDGISGRLFSAVWDNWQVLPARREELMGSDIYTLRRIVPEDRGKKW
jgi:NAD(P)-dependent dehydrogenase (short-subunit alcohol dehydrogenase family)